TELRFSEKKSPSKEIELAFFFEGKPQPAFEQKIKSYFSSLVKELPFLRKLQFEIHSKNSFPHSAGIASSASGMSALALCLCSLEERVKGKAAKPDDFFRRASHLARLGSGSAARSVFGGYVTWGKIKGVSNSSDKYATPFKGKVNAVFQNFHDDILVVSTEQKSVSSRAGHELMNRHPFSACRYRQASENLKSLMGALAKGDVHQFCDIVENEALTLHALMLQSTPPVILMQAGTLGIIKKVRAFREETGLPLCFTIDAGPNVHLLYPDAVKIDVNQFIQRELIVSCERNQFIADCIGKGPEKLNP
ncbi:MAG TPA: hypothetical protein VNJ07_05330, partial [Chitinophagales bacterium]|nr:hypothetical protein [Chitinophagales bacterium]